MSLRLDGEALLGCSENRRDPRSIKANVAAKRTNQKWVLRKKQIKELKTLPVCSRIRQQHCERVSMANIAVLQKLTHMMRLKGNVFPSVHWSYTKQYMRMSKQQKCKEKEER